jgi:hypothetical protein
MPYTVRSLHVPCVRKAANELNKLFHLKNFRLNETDKIKAHQSRHIHMIKNNVKGSKSIY